jgi:hypothetical protein
VHTYRSVPAPPTYSSTCVREFIFFYEGQAILWPFRGLVVTCLQAGEVDSYIC